MTKMPFLIIMTILTYSPLSDASSTIRNSCKEARTLPIVSSPKDLKDVMCDLGLKYPSNQKILPLVQSVIDVTKKLQTSPSWKSDSELTHSLTQLSETMDRELKSHDTPTTALSKAMKAMVEKWSHLKTRDKKAAEYIRDLDNILRMTKTGKEVMDCYAKAKSTFVSGSQVKILPKGDRHGKATMQFTLARDPKNSDKYIKTILFSTETTPIAALYLYAHEIKHGCNSVAYAEDITRPHDHSSSADDTKEETQNRAVEEMRGYRVNVELFKELALASPAIACNEYYVGSLFGKQVTSTSEYNALIDEMFEDGTFPLHLISKYTSMGMYAPETVFEIDGNGKTTRLLPELIKKIEKEGFRVAK